MTRTTKVTLQIRTARSARTLVLLHRLFVMGRVRPLQRVIIVSFSLACICLWVFLQRNRLPHIHRRRGANRGGQESVAQDEDPVLPAAVDSVPTRHLTHANPIVKIQMQSGGTIKVWLPWFLASAILSCIYLCMLVCRPGSVSLSVCMYVCLYLCTVGGRASQCAFFMRVSNLCEISHTIFRLPCEINVCRKLAKLLVV